MKVARYLFPTRSRKNGFQLFTKNEKKFFYFLINIIRTIIYIIKNLFEITSEVINYTRKFVRNYNAMKKIGYNLEDLLAQIYSISPRQFEILIEQIYKQKGYSTHLTQQTCDGGVDIILDGHIFIECKHFAKGTKVTRPMVQKLLGSSMLYNGDKCIVVTTGEYTKDAYSCMSQIDNLELLGMFEIEKMILDLNAQQISRVMMKTLNAS